MAEKHARKPAQRKEEDDSSASPGKTEKETQATETSLAADEMLDDIDRALKAACGYDEDDIVSDEEYADRAERFVRSYQQKPGQ